MNNINRDIHPVSEPTHQETRGELNRVRDEWYKSLNERNKLVDIVRRLCDTMEWVSTSSTEEDVIDVSRHVHDISMDKLEKLGYKKYGEVGQVLNENWGWFEIPKYGDFVVRIPAWVSVDEDGMFLLQKGYGEQL
jgi:hypothetical protein